MSVDELVQLVPPPLVPIDAGDPSLWKDIEAKLGTKLPQDYKQLVNLYGVGYFCGYVCPLNPFIDPPGYLHLIESGRDVMEMYEQGRSQNPKYHAPFPAYPAPNGILPWGRDDNAGLQCWLTQGHPDDWTVVILDSHYSENYCEYPTSATGFLSGWISGRINVSFYPEDVGPAEQPLFESFQPPWKH